MLSLSSPSPISHFDLPSSRLSPLLQLVYKHTLPTHASLQTNSAFATLPAFIATSLTPATWTRGPESSTYHVTRARC